LELQRSNQAASKVALALSSSVYFIYLVRKRAWARTSQVVGGPHEKMSFFQIASGPILSIPIYLKTCLYGPCKFSLKKNDPFLTYEPPKVSVFLALVTGLVTD
jgi:hypothetical protein